MTSDLAVPSDLAPAPTTLFASDDPAVVVQRATRIAEVIAPLIRAQNLVKRIGNSEHVYVEAWALAGSMLGVFATTVRTWEIGDDQGYGATVEARTLAGSVVGRADAVVMRDEEVGGKRKWEYAPAFQLISMAQTRGSSKSLRMPLGFVMKLAGYETTPAEEMEAAAARGETVSGGRGVAYGWRDLHEQTAAHRRMDDFVAELGMAEWVAMFLDSKGYTRPLAKGQMADLRRAIERELSEQSDPGSSRPAGVPVGVAPGSPGSDQTTESPSTLEPEASPTEADRSRVEGANHKNTERERGGGPPSDAASTPPGEAGDPLPPSRRPPGGHKRGRSAEDPGKVPTDRTTTERQP